MTRAEILTAAGNAVLRDRNRSYGEPENSFGDIEQIWAALDLARGDRPRGAADVALYLIAVKLIRAATNPQHLDSWVDIAGYAACGGELAGRFEIAEASHG